MLEDVICPSCGFRNAGGGESCESCNFPLQPIAAGGDQGERPTVRSGSGLGGATGYGATGPLRRPVRRAAPLQAQSVWLWLFFGTFAAGLLVYVAIDANRKRNEPVVSAVAGANTEQMAMVNTARGALAADSSNIEARVTLGNVLYDTGNWDEAIIQYRAVLRRDSTRVAPMVDLGVCYFNLGATKQAEDLFHQALRLDPHQPIALFNLGIVSERHGETAKALAYFGDALEHAPSEEFKTSINQAIQRISRKSAPGAPVSKPPNGNVGGK